MWILSCSMWALVPWLGIRSQTPCTGSVESCHWTTREVLILHQFNLPVWPVKKATGSRRMTIGDYKFNLVMPPIAAALPHIITLLEQINTHLLSLGMLLVIQQMLFSPYKLARNTRSNLLLLGKTNNITSQSCPRATSVFLLSAIIQSTEKLSILTFQ